MTRIRYDGKSTEFGLWLRQQKEIDSNLGFITSNLDYIWCNYKTGDWMLIEEKRYKGKLTFSQQSLFNKLNEVCKHDDKYKGLHKVIFENTNPDDGEIWLDGEQITKDALLTFLQFGIKG